MKSKKIITLIVLCLAAKLNFAQVDSSKYDLKKAILHSRSFWTGDTFYLDGHRINKREVNEMLMNSPASAYEFNEYKKFNNLTLYTAIITDAFLLTSLAAGHFKTINSKPSQISAGIGFGLIVPLVIFGSKRDKHFGRAFDLYNQQYRRY